MTRTQLRDLPRQDLIELARRPAPALKGIAALLITELADRLEDCGRTDDYPFITETYDHEH